MSEYLAGLIVDSDAEFITTLGLDPKYAHFEPELSVGGDPQELLKKETRYQGFFLNPLMHSPGILKWIEAAQVSHPLTPIYFLQDDHTGVIPPEVAAKLGVAGVVKKSDLFSSFLRPKISLEARSSSAQPEVCPGFVPVPTEDFLCGVPSSFDVYVRVSSGKVLKILNATETLSEDRVHQYRQKGAHYLYIPEPSYQRRLAYTATLGSQIYRIPGLPLVIKAYANMDQGNQLMRILEDTPLGGEHIEQAEFFLKELFELVGEMGEDAKIFLQLSLIEPQSLAHGVRVATLCALMCRPLKMTRAELFRQLGIACLFHDIGLDSNRDFLHQVDRMQMSAEDRMYFEAHPARGAQMLMELGAVDALACQIVAQHHERRDNLGFPKKVTPGQIHLFAEFLGLVEDCLKISDRLPKFNSAVVCDELEKKSFPGFSVRANDLMKLLLSQ